jgi:hypothetical protein
MAQPVQARDIKMRCRLFGYLTALSIIDTPLFLHLADNAFITYPSRTPIHSNNDLRLG